MAGRTPKPSMFSAGDTVVTGMGEATVAETRGQAWVKVSGVKRTWWSTSELAALNPDVAEAFYAIQAEAREAAEKAAREAEAAREAKAADREAKKAIQGARKSKKSQPKETADQVQEEPVTV